MSNNTTKWTTKKNELHTQYEKFKDTLAHDNTSMLRLMVNYRPS